jgi:hypothetical protein
MAPQRPSNLHPLTEELLNRPKDHPEACEIVIAASDRQHYGPRRSVIRRIGQELILQCIDSAGLLPKSGTDTAYLKTIGTQKIIRASFPDDQNALPPHRDERNLSHLKLWLTHLRHHLKRRVVRRGFMLGRSVLDRSGTF